MSAGDRSPELAWSEAGAPISGRFNDVYFSRDNGLAETRAVFLDGCDLPGAWRDRRRFAVAELGFGTGLNIAALIDLWIRTRPDAGRLHIFSVEGYPLSRDEAALALAAWPELDDASRRLLDQWPDPTPGFQRLAWPDIGVTLDLATGEVADMLAAWSGRADAWFLDGFAPSVNPDMWAEPVLDLIAARSAPGARVATFTVAGAVRRGLAERGFTVARRPGHGRKRERLEAVRGGAPEVDRNPRVAVIGAGVAGAAVVRALHALGVTPMVFDREAPGAGASGFPSALVTPRLDVGDPAIATFHAQALLRAGVLYRAAGAVLREGVLQLEASPRDAGRFARIADQPCWPPGTMEAWDRDACSDHLGEQASSGGLMMRQAMAVRPEAVLQAWLGATEVRRVEVAGVRRAGDGWRLLDSDGRDVGGADAVVITGGWGTADLYPEQPLAPVRGQADWIATSGMPPVAWGGYVAPVEGGFLFGATHERGEVEAVVSDAASRRNLETLAARLPRCADRIAGPTSRRAAIRATTPDRLPLAGALRPDEGLFLLGGLGSRGFCLAPLLGEHVAALITGSPSPLPAPLAHRIAPDRFGSGN